MEKLLYFRVLERHGGVLAGEIVSIPFQIILYATGPKEFSATIISTPGSAERVEKVKTVDLNYLELIEDSETLENVFNFPKPIHSVLLKKLGFTFSEDTLLFSFEGCEKNHIGLTENLCSLLSGLGKSFNIYKNDNAKHGWRDQFFVHTCETEEGLPIQAQVPCGSILINEMISKAKTWRLDTRPCATTLDEFANNQILYEIVPVKTTKKYQTFAEMAKEFYDLREAPEVKVSRRKGSGVADSPSTLYERLKADVETRKLENMSFNEQALATSTYPEVPPMKDWVSIGVEALNAQAVSEESEEIDLED